MSKEYDALMALRRPARPSMGDMWFCKRLEMVRIFSGHKRGSRKGPWPNDFTLYHFAKPSLYMHPCDWRENDPNATLFDPNGNDGHGGESWRYLGNIFDMLPYQTLTGTAWKP